MFEIISRRMDWNSVRILLVMTSVMSCWAAVCKREETTCYFWLEIDMALTMMTEKNAVYSSNGKLYYWNDTMKLDPIDSDKVITADGWETPRLVIVANGTMPGPSIEVYEGQMVIIHVKNKLSSESTSIHWHGLYQKDTPWMDGVGYVSHCPIGPGQSFTYKFLAYPAGSFIYHAHIGDQRTMGLYGPLVVNKNLNKETNTEFFAIVSDWNHDWDSSVSYLKMINGIFTNRVRYNTTSSIDGAHYSRFRFDAGLINGRGRVLTGNLTGNEAPLALFHVSKGNQYRFRWANAGNIYPFRVEIDQHNTTIVSSDAYDLKPMTGNAFMVNPGERFDFLITADQPVANYWIRATTLEDEKEHRTVAILRYAGAPDVDPTSESSPCRPDSRCSVFNCPFKYFPQNYYTDCFTFDTFNSMEESSFSVTAEEPVEVFLNFAFPGTDANRPGSVNGRAFKVPTVSAQTQPQDLGEFMCNEEDCDDQKVCECMHSVTLGSNKLYQIVLTNMGKGKGWAHPVHMHGHGFDVVKIGYSKYDTTTGKILDENPDIDCGGGVARSESYCDDPSWANKSLSGNNVPGLELTNPPRKDTIVVPTGGYVVLRIRADNPGVWFMHCHIELHNHNGMALLLNESFDKQPHPPSGFPTCGSYVTDGKINDADRQVSTGFRLLWFVLSFIALRHFY